MKAFMLTAGSIFLTASVLANAYYQKKQFYPSVVYITKSSPSLAVLYVQAFVFVILAGKLMRKLFFGQLRAAEMEHLIERSWYAVTETCLAFTVFRDDFSPKFVALFTLLLFLKSFHWLAEDRVDYMERSPLISLLFHFRVVCLMLVLAILDMYFVHHAYYSTLMKGASVQLVFGFEYAILFTVVFHILVKYVLHTIDIQSENPWENKAVYLLYAELVLGFAKVILYILFFAIMIKVHTFPLFAIRPMYLSMRTFKKALNDVIMSRRAIRNMNTLYPDATAEELSSGDNVCIICREEMTVVCKKLPCGHIFHTNCLRSWFQRQQTCPTCRMDVLRPPPTATPRPQQQPPQPQQDHQQQPQQQPQQPPLGMLPGFPGGFPMWPPPPQHQPQEAAASVPVASVASTTSTDGAAGASSSTAANTAMGMAPFMMPPFFMPMGYTAPPPMPTADLSGLSDDELRAMEGTERHNLEARLQCLRDIHTLLDAAMVQVQQYTTVISNLGLSSSVSSPSRASSQPSSYSTSTAHLSTSTQVTSMFSPSSSNSISEMPHVASQPEAGGVTWETEEERVAQSTSSSSESASLPSPLATPKAPDENTDVSGLEGAVGYTVVSSTCTPASEDAEEGEATLSEVRRRRVERFSSSNLEQLAEDTEQHGPHPQATSAKTEATDSH